MKLEFKNLGPIEHGEIDLSNKVSAFVGYNNSGKTYVSQAIWGVNRLLSDNVYSWGYELINNYTSLPNIDESIIINISNELINDFKKVVNGNLNKELTNDIFGSSNSKIIANDFFINLSYETNIDEIEFNREFVYRLAKPRPNIAESNELDLSIPDAIRLNIVKEFNSSAITVTIEQVSLSNIDNHLKMRIIKRPAVRNVGDAIVRMHRLIINTVISIIAPPYQEPFFLPANRTFFPAYYRYIYEDASERLGLVNEIADDIEQNEKSIDQIKNISKIRYTKPVGQLIDFLYNIDSEVEADMYPDILDSIEKIMGGKIEFEQMEGLGLPQFVLIIEDNKKIDLHLASSSTNQLASLYLYLKYMPFDFGKRCLIIDEPEENLHPENQLKLLDLLIQFADKGNTVIFTTHSSMVANAFNNYYMQCYRKEKNVKSINTEEFSLPFYNTESLHSSELGVYFFGEKTLTEYKSSKFGAYFSDFSDVELRLKRMTDELREELFELD